MLESVDEPQSTETACSPPLEVSSICSYVSKKYVVTDSEGGESEQELTAKCFKIDVYNSA